MIKRMTMLARREDLSVPAFRDHWLHKHADIVRGMPRLHRYLQNHVLRPIGKSVGGAAYHVDGVPELWFADEGAMAEAFRSPAAKALPVDEKNFLKGITIFGIDETVAREGEGAAKLLVLIRDPRDVAGGDHAAQPWARLLCERLPGVRRCVVNRVLKADHRQGVWHEEFPPTLILELRFGDEREAEAALQSDAYGSFAASVARGHASAVAYLVEERQII